MEFGVPTPSRLIAKPKSADGDVERHVFCAHYESCLGQAVRAGWDAWTCRRCALRFSAIQGPSTREFAQRRPRSWND